TVWRVAGLMYRFLTPALLIGRPRRCRFIHTYHGHIFHSYYGRLKTRLFLVVEKTLARLNTDRLLLLSEQQLHEIRDRFGVGRPEQFAIVPPGIDLAALRGDTAARRHLRRELRTDDDTQVIGIVARIGNVDAAIDGDAIRERVLSVASGDETAMVRAIERLLSDAPLRERLGQRGKTFAEQSYSKDRLVADIIRVSRELTARSTTTP